jgi:hypothetical protein
MTLLEAAKKGAAWMRWWLNHSECDCETAHTCGLPERQRELREMEEAIETAKHENRSCQFDHTPPGPLGGRAWCAGCGIELRKSSESGK